MCKITFHCVEKEMKDEAAGLKSHPFLYLVLDNVLESSVFALFVFVTVLFNYYLSLLIWYRTLEDLHLPAELSINKTMLLPLHLNQKLNFSF